MNWLQTELIPHQHNTHAFNAMENEHMHKD